MSTAQQHFGQQRANTKPQDWSATANEHEKEDMTAKLLSQYGKQRAEVEERKTQNGGFSEFRAGKRDSDADNRQLNSSQGRIQSESIRKDINGPDQTEPSQHQARAHEQEDETFRQPLPSLHAPALASSSVPSGGQRMKYIHPSDPRMRGQTRPQSRSGSRMSAAGREGQFADSRQGSASNNSRVLSRLGESDIMNSTGGLVQVDESVTMIRQEQPRAESSQRVRDVHESVAQV